MEGKSERKSGWSGADSRCSGWFRGESVHPNPEFPDEESIRQAVLADEFAAEQAQNTARKKEKRDAGSLLKDLIFGKE